ncbi:MAG: alpha/beta hydrolase-fold protein [Chitinophagaceae bacterium]|nr:alpha/beta hydrolase-fold protein [Chitinophagaceae bacterium]
MTKMIAMRFALISCIIYLGFSSAAQLPAVESGKIVRHADFPSVYVTPRHVDVWLPEGYNGKEKYAVLYMHDGQMLYDANTTWNKQAWEADEMLGGLMKSRKVRKTIVVGVWNGGPTRHSDYFPQKPFESLPKAFVDSLIESGNRPNGVKLFAEPVKSDGYLKFLVEELKPFIDKTYATKTDAANTFVMGSSMGGLISMYAICEYPQVFGGAACLSTHWPGIFNMENNPVPDAFIQYLDKHLPDKKTHKIYFDYGTATLDSLYPPLQAKADQVMKRNGWKKKQWITLAFPGADHSEKAWAARLDKPLMFLLKE